MSELEAVDYRIATRDPIVAKQGTLAECFERFAALAQAKEPAEV